MRFARVGGRAKLLTFQVSIVLLVVALLSGAFVEILDTVVQQQEGERVLAVANAVALTPEIRKAFDDPDPSATIQPLAEAVRQAAG